MKRENKLCDPRSRVFFDCLIISIVGIMGGLQASSASAGTCSDSATPIHIIQGDGLVSPQNGIFHTIEGVVVGNFQGAAQLGGFFVQEENVDADTDVTTSEGIFVNNSDVPSVNINVGDTVRVDGTVNESNGRTELINVTIQICQTAAVASPASITMPVANLNNWESYEGMHVHIEHSLYVTGNSLLGRYGKVDLSVSDRLWTPTHKIEPGWSAIALENQNNLSRIVLADSVSTEYPTTPPFVGVNETLRAGDTISQLTGVLNYANGRYEIIPTTTTTFARANPRDAVAPMVGGTVKVAGFNLSNYFVTLQDNGTGCGPSQMLSCSGADNSTEFSRQRDKIIAAITTMDADVIGVVEIENHSLDLALHDLIDGLNAVSGADTYAFVDTGIIGSESIKVALIYKPAVVTSVGSYAILDSSVNPTFNDTKNRPSLAQTFELNSNDEIFTVAINHFVSKDSTCNNIGDINAGDGQGNCNLTRQSAAIALVNWLATDPTSNGNTNILIIGDLNAYAKEDPIDAIKAAGYNDLGETLTDSYSYVLDGQSGYLDYALVSTNLEPLVSGVTRWHINADEPAFLDYDDNHFSSGLYQSSPYRSSDHDPVIVGLQLGEAIDTDMDTSTDVDTNTDTGIDTDTSTNTSTSTGVNTDTDTDTAINTDTSTSIGVDTDADTAIDTDTHMNTDTTTDSATVTAINNDTNPTTDYDSDTNIETDTNIDADTIEPISDSGSCGCQQVGINDYRPTLIDLLVNLLLSW